MINEITNLYFEFISSNNKKRLQMGNKLAEIAKLLLEYKPPIGEEYFQRFFIMKKVAADLLQVSHDNQLSKEPTTVTAVKEYADLAYKLAVEFYGSKPNANLVPYIRLLLVFDKDNMELIKFLHKCIENEKNIIQTILDTYKIK